MGHTILPAMYCGAGATNIRYSSSKAFDLVQESSIRWWGDVVTWRPALRLRWHSASPSPHDLARRTLVVTYDYPYPTDLEGFKGVFAVAIFALIIVTVTMLYRLRFRCATLCFAHPLSLKKLFSSVDSFPAVLLDWVLAIRNCVEPSISVFFVDA